MSDDDRLPFDPRSTGPIELATEHKRRLGAFLDENSRVVIVAVTALVIVGWYLGVSLPQLPNWALVMLITGAVSAPPTWIVGVRISKWLYSPDNVLLSAQNASTGDQELIRLAPDRFEAMTVKNHNDKTRERGYLHEVIINGKRAYEVDSYDPDENVAVASWQAGATNAEIRKDRAEIKRIKTSLEEEADKALELLANHPDIIREQTRMVSDHLVKIVEGIEVPNGGQLHEEMSSALDEADPSEDLLEGMTDGEVTEPSESDESGAVGVEVDDEHQDVFERVASGAMDRAQKLSTDGGSNE